MAAASRRSQVRGIRVAITALAAFGCALLLAPAMAGAAITQGISGNVVDSSISPLEGISVCAFEASGGEYSPSVECTGTDNSGKYELEVPPGSYKVQFRSNESPGYIEQYYNHMSSFAAADTINVNASEVRTGIDAEMQEGAGIKGTVTDSHATAIESLQVCLHRPNGEFFNCITTNSSGKFTFAGLPAGEYKVEFTNNVCGSEGCPSTNYVKQFYSGKSSLAEATLISLNAGDTKANVNAAMQEGAIVKGTVTDTHAAAIHGVQVCAREAGGPEFGEAAGCVQSDESGKYTLPGLAAGTYKVEFSGQGCGSEGCFNLNYVKQFYNGKSSFSAADGISLSAGDTKSNVNAQMAEGATIKGTVTDTHGSPIESMQVCLFAPGGEWLGCSQTDSSGKYTLFGLAAGTYKVQFSAETCSSGSCSHLPYIRQFWNGKASLSEADTITLGAGDTKGSVNAEMEEGGAIAGTVTDIHGAPIHGIQACAYEASESEGEGEYLGCEQTNASGEYEIAGLQAGSYNVVFLGESCGSQGCFSLNYIRQYYDGKPRGSEANPIGVSVGTTTPGIDAELEEGAEITGAVTDTEGHPIEGIHVCAHDASLNPWEGQGNCTQSNGSGQYAIKGVPAGEYKVEFQGSFSCGPLGCFDLNYVKQYYDGKASYEEADKISVPAGGAANGIDAEMEEGAEITGTVTDTHGAPIESMQVCTQEAGGPEFGGYSACARTDEKGEYAIKGVPTGEYTVEFQGQTCGGEGCFPLNYVRQLWDGKASFEEGDTISITAGEMVNGIDAVMQEGGQISGTVTDTHGTPLQAIEVCAYEASLSEYELHESSGCARTNAKGEYVLGGLPPGEYKFRFQDFQCNSEGCFQGNHITQYYDGKTDYEEAQALDLKAGDRLEGVDAEMQEGAEITGTVTDSHGSPIDGIMICANEASGAKAGWSVVCTSSEPDGSYALAGLPSGEYKIQFDNDSCGGEGCIHLNYINQYWNDKPGFEEGDVLAVTAGEKIEGIDAVLQEGGEIFGRVTDASTGEGVRAEEAVCVWSVEGEGAGCSSTNAKGEYALGGLSDGEYIVQFNGGPDYLVQYHDGKPTSEEADSLTVHVGDSIEINASLQRAGKIAGTVTDSHGAPIKGLTVCAYEPGGSSTLCIADATTGNNGSYVLGGLPEGEVKVGFTSEICTFFTCEQTYYIPQYWEGVRSFADATPVSVTVGLTTEGVDAAMEEGGRISGMVVNSGEEAPLEGIEVCAYNAAGGGLEAEGCTQTEDEEGGGEYAPGEYSLVVPAGSYKVEFSDPEGTYATQFWDGKASFASADAVSVGTGATHEGINAKLGVHPPVNSGPPVLSGTPAVGEVLHCSNGTWENSPTSYAYAWKRDGGTIGGQSANSYTVQSADQGHGVSCEVTATNAGGSGAAASNTLQVPEPTPTPTPAPTPTQAGVATAAATAKVKGGKAMVKLTCKGGACRGTLQLIAKAKGKPKIGKASFSVASGKSATIIVKLNRTGKKLLKKAGKAGLKATLTGSGVKSRTLKLKA